MSADPFDFNTAARAALHIVNTADQEARTQRLRDALARRAEDLVRELFPLARIQRGEARVGSIGGEVGESLAIQLTGERAGQWIDHASPEDHGDLIALWERLEGRTFPEAQDDLERWCGLSSAPAFTSRVRKVAEARHQLAKTQAKPQEQLPPPAARWHYKAADGTVLGIVTRYDLDQISEKTGKRKKTFRAMNGRGEHKMPDPRPLYRLPEIATASVVVLVEGEKCADALERVGIEATTAMGGCGTDPAKTDWSPLAGKLVVIWQDADPSGQHLAEKLRPHLEPLGCEVRVVRTPEGKPLGWDAADAVAEGDDLEAILATSRPTPQEAAQAEAIADRRRLRILSEDDLEDLPEPSWLLDDVLPDNALVMLYGPPGSRKSFAAVDMAMAIASGRDWHGRKTRAGYVLYVAAEGGSGVGKRLKGWRMSRGIAKTGRLGVVAAPVAMTTGQLDELLQIVAELPEQPVLIVLDTVARTFGAGDENSQKDMNAFVAACDKLKAATGATVLVVHHSGKDVEKGARGSSVLPGAVDVSIAVSRKDDIVTLMNRAPYGKMKDAEEFDDINLLSQQIVVGETSDGKAITTLVFGLDEAIVEPATKEHWDDAKRTAAQAQARLGSLQRSVLSHIRAATEVGRDMGLLSLTGLTTGNRGNVSTALQALQARGLIERIQAEEGGAELWRATDARGDDDADA
jgi:5S rRNA maturation endonuclease (ribonuclease M5)